MNGAGKSTLIDALAIALATLPGLGSDHDRAFNESYLRIDNTGGGSTFQRERARNGSIAIEMTLGEQPFIWTVSLERGQQPKFAGADEIQRRVDSPDERLPVIAASLAVRRMFALILRKRARTQYLRFYAQSGCSREVGAYRCPGALSD